MAWSSGQREDCHSKGQGFKSPRQLPFERRMYREVEREDWRRRRQRQSNQEWLRETAWFVSKMIKWLTPSKERHGEKNITCNRINCIHVTKKYSIMTIRSPLKKITIIINPYKYKRRTELGMLKVMSDPIHDIYIKRTQTKYLLVK